jgi:hypothetical protein
MNHLAAATAVDVAQKKWQRCGSEHQPSLRYRSAGEQGKKEKCS